MDLSNGSVRAALDEKRWDVNYKTDPLSKVEGLFCYTTGLNRFRWPELGIVVPEAQAGKADWPMVVLNHFGAWMIENESELGEADEDDDPELLSVPGVPDLKFVARYPTPEESDIFAVEEQIIILEVQ